MNTGVKPVEIDPISLVLGPFGSTFENMLGKIEPGGLFPTQDGYRLFYGCLDSKCYYIQCSVKKGHYSKLGKAFMQKETAFVQDISYGGLAGEVVRRTTGTKETIKNFMDIFLTCASVASPHVAMAKTGLEWIVKGGKFVEIYRKHSAGIEAILAQKGTIKVHMPAFYNSIIDQFLLGPFENYVQGKARKLAQDVIMDKFKLKSKKQKQLANNMVGAFLGKVGEDNFEKRLKTINTLIVKVLLKVVKHVEENGTPLVREGQVDKLASIHVCPIVQSLPFCQLTQQTGEKIIWETEKSARLVKEPLKHIADALKVWGTDSYGKY